MSNQDRLTSIGEFHLKFQQEYKGPPRLLTGDLAQFRIRFLLEEVKELAECFGLDVQYQVNRPLANVKSDLGVMANALDATVDLDYVLKGTVHLMGMDPVFGHAWEHVHERNMAKELAGDASRSTRGYALDVIKPPGWYPPNHMATLRDYTLAYHTKIEKA